jgi:hypothetical protein
MFQNKPKNIFGLKIRRNKMKMSQGEKMIWAAAFANAVRDNATGEVASMRSADAVNKARLAMVEIMKIANGNGSNPFYKMHSEMLEDPK